MSKFRYTPEEISVHRESAIRQLAGHFGSHEAGIPEWAKNAADAYIRQQIPREQRVVVLIFDYGRKSHLPSISCLDFAGMTSDDIEGYFRRWADPEAARRGATEVDLQGGHGHGGKSYMIQMFEEYAYLHTVTGAKGCKYGVLSGEIRFGYVPTPSEGRDFPVPDREEELERALSEAHLNLHALPEAAVRAFSQREGFTLVRGVNPKDYGNRIPVSKIIAKIVYHPQMARTLQLCDVYVIVNGKLLDVDQPIELPEITPMPGAEEPKEIPIPETLRDPVSGERVSTTKDGQLPTGKLVLWTSEKSMRWKARRHRHSIRFIAQFDFIGEIEMTELGVTSNYRDKLYGECYLDALEEYKLSDRSRLTESPLSRAVRDWICKQTEAYCREFEVRDRRVYSQKEKEALRRINGALDKWKNQFLDELMEGLWGGEGPGTPPPTAEPLPGGKAVRMLLTASHSLVGVGVSLRPTLKFFDATGKRVRPVPYRWVSSDANVAIVDEDLLMIDTFSLGTTHVHAETLDGRMRSNSIPLEVVHIYEVNIEPSEVELPSRSRQRFEAVCKLSTGEQTSNVYLLWVVNDSSIARVSSSGLVYGHEPGTTQVYAGDNHCLSQPATIKVVPAPKGGPGGRRGRSYPLILISEFDPDPETGDDVPLTREHPPVHQQPQDVDRNVWWINSASPLARLYLDQKQGYGYESREWRVYHLERYIEIMAKIRLALEYYQGEEISFDLWTMRWNQTASQMQEQAAISLRGFLDDGQLPKA